MIFYILSFVCIVGGVFSSFNSYDFWAGIFFIGAVVFLCLELFEDCLDEPKDLPDPYDAGFEHIGKAMLLPELEKIKANGITDFSVNKGIFAYPKLPASFFQCSNTIENFIRILKGLPKRNVRYKKITADYLEACVRSEYYIGITQVQLAKRLGITRSQLRRISDKINQKYGKDTIIWNPKGTYERNPKHENSY